MTGNDWKSLIAGLPTSFVGLIFIIATRFIPFSPLTIFIPLLQRRVYTVSALSILLSVTNISLALFPATMHHIHFKFGVVLRLGTLHITYQIQVHQLSTSCFRTLFIFQHSVRNQYFPSHFVQQPCITAT